MQAVISDLIGYAIRATDGDLGKVDEFYFDDQTWTIRYVVVETGNWLSGRKVLLSLAAFGKPEPASRRFSVDLTRIQVRNSPNVDTKRPIYRQQEVELHEHYQWPWPGGYGGTFGTTPLPLSDDEVLAEQENAESGRRDDPHLRSTRQITGYHIHATDGLIGHVEDFMVDDEDWAIRFLVADTHNWLPGKKVILSPRWVKRVQWADSLVYFDLTRESIKNSLEFNPSKPISRDYEAFLLGHFGQRMQKKNDRDR
jgi:sporulation protein YlmC with PRC-barrel domain